MSYEKHVYPSSIPDDLLLRWRAEMEKHGLCVEFHPKFQLESWEGGYLPCVVTVKPGSSPSANRYGSQPISAGFEFLAIRDPEEISLVLDDYEEDLEAEGEPLPGRLLDRLRRSPALFSFVHSGFRWTAADFRLCWIAVVAMAAITNGLVFDEWADAGTGYSEADEALLIAMRSSEEYENSPDTKKFAWKIPKFDGWDE